MKRYIFIVFFALILFFAPRVNAKSFNVVAGAGRSAVMNPSGTYYYTQWKGLSSDSLNILPIPYPNGDYYLMGSEYSFAITLTGEKSFRGHVTIPVAANTIYSYTMTNGLLQADGSADLHFGIDQNFGVYNMGLGGYNATWSCNTYTNNLGVAHNLCFYDIEFSFTTETDYEGAYNLNVAVLNTTGNRSAYYYSGIDSNGNGIEFPVNASGSQYSTVRPYLSMTGLSGDSSSPDNTDEILNGVSQASAEISDTIRESYENLVKSQEVCQVIDKNSVVSDGSLDNSGNVTSSDIFGITSFIKISSSDSLKVLQPYSSSGGRRYCFYTINKTFISCDSTRDLSSGDIISIPSNASYFRATIQYANNLPTYELCQNGNQALYDFNTEPFDSNIGATLFPNTQWYENSHFSSIITAPISFLNSLNQACTPIVLTYRNTNITLPCGTTIFWDLNNSYISTFRGFWNVLFAGLIIYRLALKLIMTVNDCLDPTKDNVGGFDI